jgi:quinolinate synthase
MYEEPEIILSDELIQKALKPIERMLDLSSVSKVA